MYMYNVVLRALKITPTFIEVIKNFEFNKLGPFESPN